MRGLTRDNYDNPTFWLNATRDAIARDCGYSNKELGVSQAIVLATSRDSDTLTRSNWESIIRDITARFGDEDHELSGWHIERFSHWAVGWGEYLIVEVYTCDVPDIEEQSYLDRRGQSALTTDVFNWIADIAYSLAERYPVYDENHYSELEHNDLYDYLSSEVKYCRHLNARGDRTSVETITDKLQSWLFDIESVCGIEDMRGDCILDGLRALGYAYKR